MSDSPQAIAAQANAAASSRQSSSRADGPVHPITFGPSEVTGGHGSAYLTRSESGVDYLEYVPAGSGRRHKVPLTAVSAVFPTITRAPRKSKQAASK